MKFSSFTQYDPATPEFYILPLFAGLSLALLGATYVKQVHGRLVDTLQKRGAHTPEEALTLQEMGLDRFPYRMALRPKNGSLRHVLACREEQEHPERPVLGETRKQRRRRKEAQRQAFASYHWYLPAERIDRAKTVYNRKGAHWGLSLLWVFILGILAFLTVFFAEELTTMTKNFVNKFFG